MGIFKRPKSFRQIMTDARQTLLSKTGDFYTRTWTAREARLALKGLQRQIEKREGSTGDAQMLFGITSVLQMTLTNEELYAMRDYLEEILPGLEREERLTESAAGKGPTPEEDEFAGKLEKDGQLVKNFRDYLEFEKRTLEEMKDAIAQNPRLKDRVNAIFRRRENELLPGRDEEY